MALFHDLPAAPVPAMAARPGEARISNWLRDPVLAFVLLSTLFGLAVLIVTPPLRGPDEGAHFLRIYGISRGEIVPATADERGRKGIDLPARLRAGFRLFEDARYQVWRADFNYRDVFSRYFSADGAAPPADYGPAPTLELYQGGEAYSPVSYLPYIAAAWVGRALGLDFLSLIYLLRLTGFVVTTAVAAYAIALTPCLRWVFLLIAMLPSSLAARAVLSADGAALSSLLAVIALALRGATGLDAGRLLTRQAWMTWCIASKPSQPVFLVLEAMARPLRARPRDLLEIALVALPGLILTSWWVAATAGDVGTWRIIESSGLPPQDFDPIRKLAGLLHDPLHIAALLAASVDLGRLAELSRQVIGVLGWLDTPLQDWTYPVLALLLGASFIAPLPLPGRVRGRIAAVAATAAVGYVLAVYLIFYLTWTPIDSNVIVGVQGRYFVVVLPLLALVVAAIIDRRGPAPTAAAAVCGAIASGGASLEALVRVNW